MDIEEEVARIRERLHDTIAPRIGELQVTKIEHEVRIAQSEKGIAAVREILVGSLPQEINGIRGDLRSFKSRVTIIFVLVLFTFGLKVADILGWTPKLQVFLK